MINYKDSVTGNKNVNYVYTIFITPAGKGYGCFSIKKTDVQNKYLVGASFCHPSDKTKFKKKIAREMAVGRANEAVSFDKDLKLDTINVIEHMLSSKKIKMPSWANRAYNIGSFTYKLKADQYNVNSLLKILFKDNNDIMNDFVSWATKKQ